MSDNAPRRSQYRQNKKTEHHSEILFHVAVQYQKFIFYDTHFCTLLNLDMPIPMAVLSHDPCRQQMSTHFDSISYRHRERGLIEDDIVIGEGRK